MKRYRSVEEVEELLSKKFEHKDILQTEMDGKVFKKVKPYAVVKRLNEVLGIDGWEFHNNIEYAEKPGAIVVGGDITINFWVDGEVDHIRTTSPKQYGGYLIKNKANIADGIDHKAAATDCLGKCASYFGLGLYLQEESFEDAGSYDTRPGIGKSKASSMDNIMEDITTK